MKKIFFLLIIFALILPSLVLGDGGMIWWPEPIHLNQRCGYTKWCVMRYPNDAMAQLARMSTEEYEDFYFNACLVDYEKMGKAMKNLVQLRGAIDEFFDNVLVMSDDAALKHNRLSILHKIKSVFFQIADFSKIVVEG